MSTGLLTNLVVSGFGLTTIGGIIFGSYTLLKHDPRPMKHFLENVKKRVLLEENSDQNIGNENGKLYVLDNAPKPKPAAPDKSPSEGEPTLPKPNIQEEEKDSGELTDGKTEKEKQVAPVTFKAKCREKSSLEVNGIGDSDFKKVEKYCTKPMEEAD